MNEKRNKRKQKKTLDPPSVKSKKLQIPAHGKKQCDLLCDTCKHTHPPIFNLSDFKAGALAQPEMNSVRFFDNVAVTVLFDDPDQVVWEDQHVYDHGV